MEEIPMLAQPIHYRDERGSVFAAIITKVLDEQTVNLVAFDDGTGALGATTHAYQGVAKGTAPGTWAHAYALAPANDEDLGFDDEDDEFIEKTPAVLADESADESAPAASTATEVKP